MKKYAIVGLVLVSVYLFSFGPFIWWSNIVSRGDHDSLSYKACQIVRSIYGPHKFMVREVNWYFDYIMWWAKLGGYPDTMTWERYRELVN